MPNKRYLSRNKIATFQGNVLPLRLLGGEEYGNEKITWKTDNKAVVQITEFSKNYPTGGEFTDGVLLTFLKPGEATVTVRHGKKTYSCSVQVREMRHADPEAEKQYYVGDMHDHTWNNHKLAEFSLRGPELYPINHYMKKMKADGKMDFAVVSDHADIINAREFFRGYADADVAGEDVIFFPGAEGQVTTRKTDRFGVIRMDGGEVLMFNADIAFETDSWEGLLKGFKTSPFAFCGYPHPQIVGISVPGIWDFHHSEHNDARFRKLFRFVELGDGACRSSNLLNRFTYSVALDAGFRVSPTCSGDGHGPGKWGYDGFPGKTVIMATEKSKEAFLDAILNNRMYASSTGNVKVHYTVNGRTAPTTLNDEGTYRFEVVLDYFRAGEPDTHIQKCKLITDKGVKLVELENMGDRFSFTVTAPDSHYFYLCLADAENRRTWSCPVWTGKPFQKKKERPLTPIDKSGITAFDRISGKAVTDIINDDLTRSWSSGEKTADLVFDLGQKLTVSALSHYPFWVDRYTVEQKGSSGLALGEFPCEYRISVSDDGEHFHRVALGVFRIFGSEETIRFEKTKARFVRLEVLSTIGKAWGGDGITEVPLTIGEITLWK
ncbi:MAG: discoidin domain-containing protein [Oscillospiraceae bacterium]|nr:discoidin domain-containing protein [Oscillospiraceae bacterium]